MQQVRVHSLVIYKISSDLSHLAGIPSRLVSAPSRLAGVPRDG